MLRLTDTKEDADVHIYNVSPVVDRSPACTGTYLYTKAVKTAVIMALRDTYCHSLRSHSQNIPVFKNTGCRNSLVA